MHETYVRVSSLWLSKVWANDKMRYKLTSTEICWNMLNTCPWWRHQMEIYSALLAICAGNSPVTCELSTQRPVTQSFGVFFDLRLNKRLRKQWWGWWFETPPRQLWCHCNEDRDRAKHLRDDIPDKVITSVSRCSVLRKTKPIICNGKMKSYVICLTNNQFHKWKSDKTRHCRPRKRWQWNFNKCFVLTHKIKFYKQLIGLRCSWLIRICAIRCKLTVAEASPLFKGRWSILLDVGL